MLQVEILRNAISYIQSLEKCLGISLEDERKENVVSSTDCEENKDYETFKCIEVEADESVTSISVPLQDRRSSSIKYDYNNWIKSIMHLNEPFLTP